MKNTENIENNIQLQNASKKSKKKSLFKIFLVGVCVFFIIIAIIFLRYKQSYPGKETDFASQEEFVKYGGIVLVDIPKEAEEIKYYCDVAMLWRQCGYSFVIPDEEAYQLFMENKGYDEKIGGTVKEYMTKAPKYNEEFRMLEWFKYITDEDITDYRFVYYDAFDGSFEAIIVDEEERRFIVLNNIVP